MPRTLRPRLRTMLERANPNVATFVEVSVPDTGKILRRAEDQFLTFTPDGPLVSMTPAVSAQASPSGALSLASVSQTLISQFADAGTYFYLPQEQGSGKFHGTVGWTLDEAFPGAVLRAVTVKLRWISPLTPDVALQIYKVHRTAGVIRRQQGTSTVETFAVQHSFAPLLAEPVVKRFKDIGVLFSDQDVTFDLTPYHLAIDPRSAPPPGPNESGDLPEYFFEIQPLMQPTGNFVGWARDTTSARVIANIGTVRDVGWQRANPDDPASLWVRTDHPERSLTIKIDVEQYAATSQAVYALTLPALPSADSTGRVVFRHGDPEGTDALLELSTAGASGPWTPVADGDEVVTKQATYHARLTMDASADGHRSPVVSALGVEFRTSVDVSAESTLEPMTQGVAIPFCAASIGEGSVAVVRAGRRDYRDWAAIIASEGPDTQLELDAYLGSRHPLVTRADWFHTTRAQVSTRLPTGTAERFSLLSIAKTLKRKIPARVESISAVHTVVSASTTQVQVSPNLTGASAGGNEYDGKGYYIRVRKSAQPGVETGQTFTIDGNTGVDKLDFPANADPVLSHELPGTFAAGDEIEVHSARYAQPALQWVDQDPADIWWELLTVHLGVPENRIGLADVGGTGRAGLPPTVADRAPGNTTTQDLLKVTLKITDAEDGDALIDQLSFIMGGATVEIAGQLVFRQIYALKDADGRITVAPDPVVKTFDARDYTGLDTPTGREQRITVCACDYGVDTTSAAALPTATTNFVDVDALDAYELQDVEGLGTDKVPDEIARWCYNSTDLGKFLATQLAQQVVGACSTGVRLWPFTTIDAHPELTVGDTVVVITDQYTDFDPARGVAVKGMMAYPVVLVSTAAGGRRFVGFLQGLAGVVGVDVRGGDGTLQDNNPTPAGVGPSLDVTASAGPSDYTISYSAANGTLALYIDGAGPSAVPASPFTVARPAAGSEPLHYTIQITGTNGQVLSDTVEILAVGGADANTVTPDLTVSPSGSQPSYTDFLVTASNPSGGAAPAIAVLLNGVTGQNLSTLATISDGVAAAVTSGQTIRVFRGLPGAVAQATATFTATIGGGGSEVIQRTIPPMSDAAAGQQILSDPAFAKGLAGYNVYDNFASGHVHHTLGTDSTTPNATGKYLQINVDASTTPGVTVDPGFGGFSVGIGPDSGSYQKDTYHRGAMIEWRVRAFVPVGYTINWAANAFGTGAVVTPLTPMAGTGAYFDYRWLVQVGTSGTFSTIGYFYLTGTGTGPIGWQVAQVTANDRHQTPTFGPSLDVVATPGSPYLIAYTASGGTVELSINGAPYSTAPASPISVGRPGAGAAPYSYAFRLIADGQTITDEVTVPSTDADTNTVTPDLSVTPLNPADTTQQFVPAATNPSGGAAPSLYVTLRGTTGVADNGVGALADGVETALPATGTTVTVNRPPFGTTTQASVTFRATLSGGGSERIQRTILNQVKTSFGPSLTVTTSIDTASNIATIGFTVSADTLELSIDNGGWSVYSGPNPITRALDGAPHSYDFRATRDGQVVPGHADVPALVASGSSVTAVVERSWVSATNYTTNVVTLSWSGSGSLGTGQYEVLRIRTDGTTPDFSTAPTSLGYTSNTFMDDAVSDDLITTTGPKVTYAYLVRVTAADTTVLRSSPWISVTYSHA